MEYKTVLTTAGLAAIAAAVQAGGRVAVTHLAMGDGGGAEYAPDSAQSGLKNECWRGAVASYTQQDNRFSVTARMPAGTDAFVIRELAVFLEDGTCFAVANAPSIPHQPPSGGVGTEFEAVMPFVVENAENVTVTVDPAGAVPWGAVGAPGGVAPLDGDGKVPKEYLGVQGYQVGDILTTVRTDLDDSWLLCNGELVQRSEYQCLAELFPKRYDLGWNWISRGTTPISLFYSVLDVLPSLPSTNFRIYNVFCHDGRYFAAGQAQYMSSTKSRYGDRLWVAYTDDINSKWTVKIVATLDSPYASSGNFVYEDGRFLLLVTKIIVGESSGGNDKYSYDVYYSSENEDLLGEWSHATVVSNIVADRVYTDLFAAKFAYQNGNFFVVGQYYDESIRKYKAALWFSSSIEGPYEKQDLWHAEDDSSGYNGNVNNVIYDIHYVNGKYVIVGYYGDSTTIKLRVGYTTDFRSEEWTFNDIYTIENIVYGTREMGYIHFSYMNGNYIVSSTYGQDPLENTSMRTYHRIFYSNDLLNWTDRSYSVGYRLWAAAEISYDNGKYVTAILKNNGKGSNYGSVEFHVFNDFLSSNSHLSYEAIYYDASLTNQDSFSTMWCICHNDKFAVISIPQHADEIATYDIGVIELPTITTEGAYNYIKAKEDDA